MAYGLAINLKKCVGCQACANSCKAANGTPPGVFRAWVTRTDIGTYPNVRREIIPHLCNQCENPPCVAVCPSGASTKDDDSVVRIDKEICIGCKACITACPYGSRYFVENNAGYFGGTLNEFEALLYEGMPSGVVDKCDFCSGNGRLKAGENPACVEACQYEARLFGELEQIKVIASERDGVQMLPEQGTSPSVYYLPNVIYE